MYEMLVGIAIGYIAFTENGHKIGNSIADYATKSLKPAIEKVTENNLPTSNGNTQR